ncbi:hypothetical protein ACJIZ3_019000 [Penstemon smallii]|uniref:Uncharacterized protein n=1 Tax=Penstemon smallii TaxID=265156 RepID=A0ABD3T0I5_9LAMI
MLGGPIPVTQLSSELMDFSSNNFSVFSTFYIHGTIPSCLVTKSLTVLNLRRNRLSGNIPDFFPNKNLSELCMLVLQSNIFYGKLSCLSDNYNKPNLKINDLDFNIFHEILPANLIQDMKAAMMVQKNGTQPQPDKIHWLLEQQFPTGSTQNHWSIQVPYFSISRTILWPNPIINRKIHLTTFEWENPKTDCNLYSQLLPQFFGIY